MDEIIEQVINDTHQLNKNGLMTEIVQDYMTDYILKHLSEYGEDEEAEEAEDYEDFDYEIEYIRNIVDLSYNKFKNLKDRDNTKEELNNSIDYSKLKPLKNQSTIKVTSYN